MGVVTKIDDASKIAANLFASKSYEPTIAAGEAVGSGGGTILGAIIASGPAAYFGATTPLGVLILGGFAAVGGILGGEAGKAFGGAKWIADNAPKLNDSDQFESSVRVDGIEYIAVLAVDSNRGARTFYYANTESIGAGQRYRPVTDLDRISAIESRLLNDLGYDSSISQAQYFVQSGLSASGIPVGEVRYIEVGGQFSSPDGSSSQSVLQISTARDEITNAPYEIRTPGRIVNGQFEASLGSVRIGMDSAGRIILFDDVAKSALGFSSSQNKTSQSYSVVKKFEQLFKLITARKCLSFVLQAVILPGYCLQVMAPELLCSAPEAEGARFVTE